MWTTTPGEDVIDDNPEELQGITGWLIKKRLAADAVQANRTLVVALVVMLIFIAWLNWPSGNRQSTAPLGPPRANPSSIQ
jgi:hypothetical protein